jgi:ankyrin repeat protein
VGQGLLVASRRGHLPVVQWLLSNGAHVTDVDDDGNTPLLIAAFCGHLDLVRAAALSVSRIHTVGHVAP